jgi:hypothetical protein
VLWPTGDLYTSYHLFLETFFNELPAACRRDGTTRGRKGTCPFFFAKQTPLHQPLRGVSRELACEGGERKDGRRSCHGRRSGGKGETKKELKVRKL